MCLRLKLPGGISAKKFLTSTPKPYQFLRDAVKDAETDSRLLITRGTTFDNAANLSDTMFKEIAKYEGTQIGRQEIYGDIISGDTAGIIKRSWIKLWSKDEPLPKLKYVFTSYDPAFTAKKENDPTGVWIFGLFKDIDNTYSVITLDGYDVHLSYPDLRAQIMVDYEEKYGEGTNKKRPIAAIVEKAPAGHALIEELARTKIKLIKFAPGNSDKVARAHAVSWFFKDGKFYVPESKKRPGEPVSYLGKFIDQITNFPMVEHDDMMDAVTQALLLLTKGELLTGDVTDRDDDDDDDDDENVYRPPSINPYSCI